MVGSSIKGTMSMAIRQIIAESASAEMGTFLIFL